MVVDFFNFVFSKGQYQKNPANTKTVQNNVQASSETQQQASIMPETSEPRFSYINEMKNAQNQREENINRFLTTPGFIETLEYYRPNEHPELSGYASTVGDVYYGVLKDLNSLLLNKNKGEELVNLLMNHFEGKADTPESYFAMIESYCFTPESKDSYQYYGDTKNIDGLRKTIEKGNDAVYQLREDLGSRVTSFEANTNDNGYVTDMSVAIDGCYYGVSYEYFEDSGYPLSKTQTKTVDGVTSIDLTCYSYGGDGEHLSDIDFNDDGTLDTIINYDEFYNVKSYQNVDIASLYGVEPDAVGVRNCVMYGNFSSDRNFSESLSKKPDGTYILHTKDIDGNAINIPMDNNGYISCADFYNFMQTNKSDDPITQIINPSENAAYRYNSNMQIEKVYLDDNSMVVYNTSGELVSGKDRTINNNEEIEVNEKIEDFSQGNTAGDCWLLSALDALSANKEGAKVIKKAISDPLFSSDTYNVKLGGKKYSVTEDEMMQAKNNTKYSQGDDDVLLFELGYEKYLADVLEGKAENPFIDMDVLSEKAHLLDGGSFAQVMYALGFDSPQKLSDNYFDYYNEQYNAPQYEFLMQELENNFENYVATVSFLPENDPMVYGVDSSGNQVLLANTFGHAWSVQSIQNGFVTLSNPWDTENKTVTMSASELKKVASEISLCYIK